MVSLSFSLSLENIGPNILSHGGMSSSSNHIPLSMLVGYGDELLPNSMGPIVRYVHSAFNA